MHTLLSLPPNVVADFHAISNFSREAFFVTSDPIGQRLGSGGGTTFLLEECAKADTQQPLNDAAFSAWLSKEKRILLHAGGQSRRLPAYAAAGKVLLPVPVFRWARGQKLDQTLLSLQLPLYERIMKKAPASLRTLIASGDVLIRATEALQDIPEADVVCYGLWAEPSLARNHGVFMLPRNNASQLDFMLQKPSVERLKELAGTHLCLLDIGVWLLSDRAVERLRQKSYGKNGERLNYDLYSQFGTALGLHPTLPDADLADLTVAVLPLPGGEFHHFGTSAEMISSTHTLQNIVKDQRLILQKSIKAEGSVFTQNALVETQLTNEKNLWVENAHVPATLRFSGNNVVTGLPRNAWQLTLPSGICIDVQPVADDKFCLRPYSMTDAFRGDIASAQTSFLGRPMPEWLAQHGLAPADFAHTSDLQNTELFPVVATMEEAEAWLKWMLAEQPDAAEAAAYKQLERLSADTICQHANLRRAEAQRRAFRKENLALIAHNWRKSVFYQTDLADTAQKFAASQLPAPAPLPESEASPMLRIRDAMFRAELLRANGAPAPDVAAEEAVAFSLQREQLIMPASQHPVVPRLSALSDQIVWGRSAVRIDLAGGWTDTPPYCLTAGGAVVNMALELNGQQPLQVYVKPSKEPHIICRSIDLGAMEMITTYDELSQFARVGSPFSIPKAALALCGFLPAYCAERYASLKDQLQAFGGGIEITLLSAIPAGSGLGTSSVLAATVLGALSDFCSLRWDKMEIGRRTLILEQLLTTGGGWQDQFGGVLGGVKLLETGTGFDQTPTVRYLPTTLFTSAEYRPCHLLYYTGVTRTAKHILAEIVRGMFLNSGSHLGLLNEMGEHARSLFDVMQRYEFEEYGRAVRQTWAYNCALDAGTNPPVVDALCRSIDDLCLGYKLPGAGGGGYLYMVAKDPEAAARIVRKLSEQPLTPSARFVEMTLSEKGLQVSRS